MTEAAKTTTSPRRRNGKNGKRVSLPNITSTFEEITPALAGEWLELNKNNRTMKEGKIDAFARDMKSGNFQTTHQGVAFNDQGELIDGQHRLMAIIRSNTPVVMQVTRGLPDEIKPTIDTGTKRSVADTLRIQGYENRAVLGAVARMAMLYEQETPIGMYARAATVPEVVDFIHQHEERLIKATRLATHARPHIPAQPTVVGTAYDIFVAIDEEQANLFFDDIIGLRLGGEGDPRVTLVRRLGNIQKDRERISPPLVLSMFIRAWNAWRTGQTLKSMPVDRVRSKKVLEAI
jgi:hypothetical protein